MSGALLSRFMGVCFFVVTPCAFGLPGQCSPLSGTEVGMELVGSINETLSESSPEMCCYYADRANQKAWTFLVEGGDTCAKQTVLKGVAWEGGGSGSHVVQSNSSDDCCSLAVASGRPSWTFDSNAKSCSLFSGVRGRRSDSGSTSGLGSIPGLDSCSNQTLLDGVAFDQTSSAPGTKVNSSGECCAVAQGEMRSIWSYNKRTKDCYVFYDVRGRHTDPDAVSAISGTPNMGTCKIFSKVSGKKSNPRAVSVENGIASSRTDLI